MNKEEERSQQDGFLGLGKAEAGRLRKQLGLIFAAGALLTLGGVVWAEMSRANAFRRETQRMIRAQAMSWTHVWARLYLAARTVAAGVARSGPAAFDPWAEAALAASPGIEGVGFGRQSWERLRVKPGAASLQEWLGRSWARNPLLVNAAAKALQSRSITVSAPIKLSPQRFGCALWVPVFGGGPGRPFVGFVTAWADLANLARLAGFESLEKQGVRWALYVQLPGGGKWARLLGKPEAEALRSDPGILIGGVRWRIGLSRAAPAISIGRVAAEAGAGLLLVFLAMGAWSARVEVKRARSRLLAKEQEASREKERFGRLLEALPEATLILNPKGRLVLANAAAGRLLGKPRSKLLGCPIGEIVPELKQDETLLPQSLAGEKRVDLRRGEGETVRVAWLGAEMVDPASGETRIVAILRPASAAEDETLRRRLTDQAVERIFAGAPVAALRVRNDRIAGANPAALRLLGLEREEDAAGRAPADFAPEEQPDGRPSQEAWTEGLALARREGKQWFRFFIETRDDVKGVEVALLAAPVEGRDESWVLLHEISLEWSRTARWLETAWQTITLSSRDTEHWIDLEGRLVWVSPSVESLLGWMPDEYVRHPGAPASLVHEEDRAVFEEVWSSLLQGGSGAGAVVRLRRRDGRYVRTRLAWHPVWDGDRRAAGCRLTAAPAPAETAPAPEPTLRSETQELLEFVLSALDAGVREIDLAARKAAWDERLLKLYGLSPEEFRRNPESWRDRIHPEDRPRVEAAFEEALREKKEGGIAYRVVLPNGRTRRLAEQWRALPGPDGTPKKLVSICRAEPAAPPAEPIRKSAPAEEGLPAEALFNLFAAEAEGAAWAKDAAGRYRFLNRAWADLLGASPEAFAGRTDAEIFGDQAAALFAKWEQKAAEEGKPVNASARIARGEKRLRISYRLIPLRDAAGKLRGFLGRVMAVAEDSKAGPDRPAAPEKPKPPEQPAAPPSQGTADTERPSAEPDAAKEPPRRPEAGKTPPPPAGEQAGLFNGAEKPPKPPQRAHSTRKRDRTGGAAWTAETARRAMGLSEAEFRKAAARFGDELAERIQRLRKALALKNWKEAVALAEALAAAAGRVGADSLRHAARAVELALRRSETELVSSLAEDLETEAVRVLRGIKKHLEKQ